MKKVNFYLFLIILLAAFLRLYNLGGNPPSLYGDEQAFAWNAWNILKTGQDEYGNFLPLQFKSFNDYKSPVPVYLLVPFLKILGLNPWAIRLPVALAGIATVGLTFLLVRLFLNSSIALWASFLLAISPWHVHLSRGFFEATLALTFFLAAIYFFFKAKEKAKYLIWAAFFFIITLYTYFTPRILLPFFVVFLIIYSRDWLFRVKKYLLLFLLLITILSLPLVKMTLLSKGATRMQELMGMKKTKVEEIVNRERYGSVAPRSLRILLHNKAVIWAREFKNNYLEHLSLNFWYLYGDNSLRYFTGNMGMFYLFELPFFAWGLWFLLAKKTKAAIFFLGWILLAPIPAALVGRSFAIRSLAMLPAPLVFTAAGISQFWQMMTKIKRKKLAWLILVIGFSASLGTYLARYYLDYPAYAATWWGWENKVAIDYAKNHEKEYEKIFISDYYTGTTMAFAVYEQIDPLDYRRALKNPVVFGGDHHFVKFGKFYFGSFGLDEKDLQEKIIPEKSLYIAGPMEPEGEAKIVAPDDGRVLFKIHDTSKQ